MTVRLNWLVGAAAATMLASGPALGAEMANGGKLLLTGGLSDIEGGGGGGLASWAVVTGYETRDGVGANLNAMVLALPNFTLRSYGVAVGLHDRLELSYARQALDTRSAGAKLGLGDGFTFNQDVFSAKLRLFGDALYNQNSWLPQVAAGVQVKQNEQTVAVRTLGAKSDFGVDYYLAATKFWLDDSLVLDATLRMTRANQFGLLGFGGDRGNDYHPQFEGSAGYMLSRRLIVGGEYRSKPDNLGFAKEDGVWDIFGAYAFNKTLSATLAYADLGAIAGLRDQRGLYVSLQAGF